MRVLTRFLLSFFVLGMIVGVFDLQGAVLSSDGLPPSTQENKGSSGTASPAPSDSSQASAPVTLKTVTVPAAAASGTAANSSGTGTGTSFSLSKFSLGSNNTMTAPAPALASDTGLTAATAEGTAVSPVGTVSYASKGFRIGQVSSNSAASSDTTGTTL